MGKTEKKKLQHTAVAFICMYSYVSNVIWPNCYWKRILYWLKMLMYTVVKNSGEHIAVRDMTILCLLLATPDAVFTFLT